MKDFTEAMKATEEMFAQMEYSTIPKVKKQENHNKPPQMEDNKTDKTKIKKTHILVLVYVALIIIELFYCVPYHSIQIFESKQNVPHTEITGGGYATMDDIENDNATIDENEKTGVGKRVDTSQIFINVSITTIVFVAIYWLFLKNENKKIDIHNLKDYPDIDLDGLCFADEDTVAEVKRKYVEDVYDYVRNVLK